MAITNLVRLVRAATAARLGARQVGGELDELAVRARDVGGAGALDELLERQSSLRRCLAQPLHGLLALGVGDSQLVVEAHRSSPL
jgi:hypothetical protein